MVKAGETKRNKCLDMELRKEYVEYMEETLKISRDDWWRVTQVQLKVVRLPSGWR